MDNLFDFIPKDTGDEIFNELVRADHVRIERIISRGHASPASGWHDQEETEWVVVLKGAAIITFDNGEEVNLQMGSHLTIAAHRKHRVTWTSPDTETIWLAVHYR